jgi:hypothetical protein
MNLAQALDPRTGHIDETRVRDLEARELGCGFTLEELLQIRRVSVRVHERRLSPGQGKRQEEP